MQQPNASDHWLIDFSRRYDAARRQREDGHRRSSVAFDISNPFHVRAADERAMIKKRVEQGFVLPFSREVGGRIRQPFQESGLRSVGNPILKLFVARLPRKGQVRASDNKADLHVPYWSKLLTLDSAYIEANKEFLSFIRLDCDAIFASTDACIAALQMQVQAKAIPHLPHIVVGDTLDDGSFANPHFIYMLRNGVWNNKDDARCRRPPKLLFEAVSRGLVAALLDIGVDTDAPTATMRCKNPLSPIWTTVTPNVQDFMSLTEYAAVVDMKTTRQELSRKSAALRSKMGKSASNELFNAMVDHGSKLLTAWHFGGDLSLDDRETLGQRLFGELEAYADTSGVAHERRAYVSEKVASYLATTFDPMKLEKTKHRKRLAHVLDDVASVEERQRVGAKHAQGVRANKSYEILRGAVLDLSASGKLKSMSKEMIAIRAGVSRAYVYKHMQTIVDEISVGVLS